MIKETLKTYYLCTVNICCLFPPIDSYMYIVTPFFLANYNASHFTFVLYIYISPNQCYFSMDYLK